MTSTTTAPAKPRTTEEVADLLRISQHGVYHLVRTGRLDAIRVGRGFRFTQAAIDKFLGESQ